MIEKAFENHDIRIAENGEDALNHVTNLLFIPNLIFLDINMPKMNGWEFLEALQKTGLTPEDTAVFLMLGTALPETKKQLIERNALIKGCLPKMLTQPSVLEIVSKFNKKQLTNNCL
jgi:CheY-like chemotaxis protein